MIDISNVLCIIISRWSDDRLWMMYGNVWFRSIIHGDVWFRMIDDNVCLCVMIKMMDDTWCMMYDVLYISI